MADKPAYGKALFVVAMAPLLRGIIGLLGSSDMIAIIAVLIIGIVIGIGFIIAVQMKYNKGILQMFYRPANQLFLLDVDFR